MFGGSPCLSVSSMGLFDELFPELVVLVLAVLAEVVFMYFFEFFGVVSDKVESEFWVFFFYDGFSAAVAFVFYFDFFTHFFPFLHYLFFLLLERWDYSVCLPRCIYQ